MRTPIGAISISPESNLGSLERGECASFAVDFARRTCRRMGDKKKERERDERKEAIRVKKGGDQQRGYYRKMLLEREGKRKNEGVRKKGI